jgi:hypothetical protein
MSMGSHAKILRTTQQLTLSPGQAFLLHTGHSQQQCAELLITQGFCRISACMGDDHDDLTLAIAGPGEPNLLRIPAEMSFMVEAVTASSLTLQYLTSCPSEVDLIYTWLLQLHHVRHSLGAEARLIRLLQLLVNQFGIREATLYRLPLCLAHARLAEMICSTRSTVTRQLAQLKRSGDVRPCDTGQAWLFSAGFMELHG